MIFLSCSDEIKYGFASHACDAFCKEGIAFIIDKEEETEKAIEKAEVLIPIISRNYATSKKCLDELVLIVKNHETKHILLVLYHVNQTDLMSQKGCFEKAFDDLGKTYTEEVVNMWRNAFRKIAEFTPHLVRIDRPESEVVQNITRDVCKMLKRVCSLDTRGPHDAILQPTTPHRTSSMPVSGGLYKKKQIADVKVGKLRPQAASCRTSLVPSVSVADAASSAHLNMQKMLSWNNQAASTSSSFSDVIHGVDRLTLAKVAEVDGELVSGYETPIIESNKPLVPNRELSNDIAQTEDLFGSLEDLLTEIFKKLRAFSDFAVCSTVCGRWRSACLNLKWSLYPQHPWSIHFQGQNIMNNLDDGKYVLERWEIDGRHYYSCVNGWILNIGSTNIHIFNLFSMTETSLPMLSPVGYLRHIVKFILFKTGHGDNLQFSVVALFDCEGFIAFKRPGFQHWIYIERIDDIACCIDVVLFQGRFYALCDRGNLFEFVFYSPDPHLSLVATQHAGSSSDGRYYLVKNVDHLIAVFQKGEVGFGGKRFDTETFRIYRHDITTSWTRIRKPDYLKGRALFISSGNSWTIDPAEVESCRTNSIYFVDDYWFSNNRDGYFIGVFDIANGTIEDFQFEMDEYPPNDASPFSLSDNVGA